MMDSRTIHLILLAVGKCTSKTFSIEFEISDFELVIIGFMSATPLKRHKVAGYSSRKKGHSLICASHIVAQNKTIEYKLFSTKRHMELENFQIDRLKPKGSFPEPHYWYADHASRCCFCCRDFGNPRKMGTAPFCVRSKPGLFKRWFSSSAIPQYLVIKGYEFDPTKHLSALEGTPEDSRCCPGSNEKVVVRATYLKHEDNY